jgi:hypothetical protein
MKNKLMTAARAAAASQNRLVVSTIVYASLMIGLFLAQLGMGANLSLDISFLIISLTPILVVDRNDIWPADILYFSLAAYFGGMSLIFKTALLQPLQQNLFAPDMAALYQILSFASITVALICIRLVRRYPSRTQTFIAQTIKRPQFVRWMARIFYAMGFGTQVLAAIFKPQLQNGVMSQSEGFGGFGSFYFMMVFGLAAQMSVALNAKEKSFERLLLATMFVGALFIAMISNVKKPLYDAIILACLSVYAFKIKIKPGQVAMVVAGLVFMQVVVSPLIHIVRYEATAKSPIERITATMDLLREYDYDFGKLSDVTDVQATTMHTYRADQSYYYPSTANIDRFSLILPTDQVVRSGQPAQLSPWDQLLSGVRQTLPSFVIEHTSYVGADEVAWTYGIRDWGAIARPVIGVTASSYATGGLWAVLTLPGALFGILFWVIDRYFGRLSMNILGVAIAAYIAQYAEKEIDAIVVLTIRDMVITIVTLYIAATLYRLASGTATDSGKSKIVPGRFPIRLVKR